ncbi:uncharacterized protein LOC132171905 isoform X2 [Corylus avellana]|uniref:uncharacterized protein LOC132171905 isoform X2 n=1 Tax=Corylus avellana TaxID=13451 RepID=UPI00286C25FB|nr:uncharacterized protein LOC132171905 isoform X2 [Corylus avellana]
MEFDDEQHGVSGRVPKCGAIFMSNSTTKKECLRRGLFGLPSSHGHFVKQVKAGMILFLFDYDKRHLHGVFRACSDGAIDIVPHAFGSSGKQFSAQVRRLLCLFSLRRATDHLPHRQSSKIKGARANDKGKVRRVDDGGATMREEVKDLNDLDNDYGPVVLNEYSGKSSGYGGRESDESRFAKSDGLGNKHKAFFADSLAKSERESDESWFAKSDGLGNKHKSYDELELVTRNEYFEDSLANAGRDGGRFAGCYRSGSEHNLAIEHGSVLSNDPPRYLSGKVGPMNEYFEDSLAKVGRDGGRFAAYDRSGSGRNLAIDHRPVLSNDRSGYLSGKSGPMNEYYEDSLAKVGRDGGRLAACDRSGSGRNLAIDHGPVMSNDHSGYLSGQAGPMNDHFEDSLAKVGRDGGRFAACDRSGSGRNLAIEHERVVSNDLSGYLSGKAGHMNEYFEDSLAKAGRDGGRFAACEWSGNGHNLAIEHGSVVSNDHSGYLSGQAGPMNEYFEDSSAKVGRDGGRFAACDRSGSVRNLAIEHGHVVSNDHSGYLSGKVGQVPDHDRFTMTNRLESENIMDNDFVLPISTERRSLFQPNLDRSVYSNNSVFKDQHRLYTASSDSTERQICYPSYSTLYGDALGMSTLPSDPESANIYSRYSSSPRIDHSSNSVKECASPHKTYAGTLIPSPKNQLYFPSVDPKCRKRGPDDSSGFGNPVSVSTPDNYDDYLYGTSMPLSRDAYSENLAVESSENPGYKGLSFLRYASAPLHLSETENNGRENKGSSFYSGFPGESLGKLEREVARQEKNEAFTDDVPLSNHGQLQLHGRDYSVEPKSDYHHEHSSLNYDLKYDRDFENTSSGCQKNRNSVFSRLALASDVHVKKSGDDFGHKEYDEDTPVDEYNSLNHDLKYYQGSENMSSGCQKNRNSVFSRLTLSSDVRVKENGDDIGSKECDGDTSVDEVMSMLRQSLFQSAKTKKSKTLVKQNEEHENSRDTKQTTFCPKLEMDCLVDFKYSSAGRTPCVDFKRRSEIRKGEDNTKSRQTNEIAGSDGSSGRGHKRSKLIRPNFSKKESSSEQGISSDQHYKRRKLIRPSFSKKEPSNEQGINDDVSKSTDVLSQESSVNNKDKRGSCEVLVGSQDQENKSSQSVELLQRVISLVSGENKNINVEKDSNGKGESKAESCKAFSLTGYEDGKESSQDAVIKNASEDKSQNAENGLRNMDSVVDELPDTTPSCNRDL